MPRSRKNDPLGVSDNPVCVTDPVREAELCAELRQRMRHLRTHFMVGKRVLGGPKEFNAALRQLKCAVAGETPASLSGTRLPPLLELAVSAHARRRARKRSPEAAVEGEDVRRASRLVARRARPISHRPHDDILHRCVEGLTVLIQQYSGLPVLADRYRNSVYEPHFKPGISQLVPMFFQDLDPSITVTQLVTIVEQVRKRYAGEELDFDELFPGYGAHVGEDGAPELGPRFRVEHFELNVPTYFH